LQPLILGATTVKAPVEEELTITRALSMLLVRMYTCIGRSKSFHYQSPPLLWIALLWLPEMGDDALPPSASSNSIHNEVREDMRKT